MLIIYIIGFLLLAPFVFWILYLLILSVAAWTYRNPRILAGNPERKFVLMIPSHDEEMTIRPVIEKVKEVDYPQDMVRLIVLADNCSDRTAEIARDAGAEVWERSDLKKRGKGYVLDWALKRLTDEGAEYDAVAIIDADTFIDPGFFRGMDRALKNGGQALQGHYSGLNPDESWRTRLLGAAWALFNYLRPLGRTRLGFTAGLFGNGMCFRRSVMEKYGWSSHSITEDAEYAIHLLEEGIKVRFVPGARVYAQMPVTEEQARSQRKRWEGGRGDLVKKHLPVLIRDGLRKGSPALLDAAVDQTVPPFAILLLGTIFFLCIFGVLNIILPGEILNLIVILWWAVLIGQVLYLYIGLAAVKAPIRLYLALVYVPVYIGWKLKVYLQMASGYDKDTWVRTERKDIRK